MKKKKDSVLALTLIVLAILMVLISTLFVVVQGNNKIIISNDNINKLNVMAESGIDVALAQVKKASSSSSLQGITELKSTDGTITCNVIFYKGSIYQPKTNNYIAASGKDTIESTASNGKETKIIRVTISEASTAPIGTVPTDNLFFINGTVSGNNFNCGVANGDVYVNGNFYMSSGSAIKGKLISTGNITLTGGSSSTNGVISFGNVELDGGGSINGDSLVKGALTFGGGTKINGNVQCDGNLNMPQGNILNNVTIGGNATFDGGSNKIGGKLYYKGTATSNNGGTTVAQYVPSGAIKTTTYTTVDLSRYTSSTPSVIKVPTSLENSQLYSPVTLSDNKISTSGSLSSSLFNSVSYGSTITIDTSTKDISLLVNGFTFAPGKGLNFEVNGTHNLYIYLTGPSAFSVDSNQFIGMKNHSATPQIFIIGDGNQSVNLNNCELDAYIYIPNGSFSAGGGAPSTYMFQGSCVTKSVNIGSQINLNYLKPNITGTPLENLNSGGSGSGSVSFSIDNWYN